MAILRAVLDHEKRRTESTRLPVVIAILRAISALHSEHHRLEKDPPGLDVTWCICVVVTISLGSFACTRNKRAKYVRVGEEDRRVKRLTMRSVTASTVVGLYI